MPGRRVPQNTYALAAVVALTVSSTASCLIADIYRWDNGQLIAGTVSRWDPDETSQRIELQVGRDLQFVRINGTLVGGLVGLILFALSRLLEGRGL